MTATATGKVNTSHPMANEMGLLLHVDAIPYDTMGGLERRFGLPNKAFSPVASDDRATPPTVQYYAFVAKAPTRATDDVRAACDADVFANDIRGLYHGFYSIATTSTYFCIQGAMLRFTWVYHALQCPTISAYVATMITYYNTTMWDVVI